MYESPHVLLRNFEFLILFPLCILCLLLCLSFFVTKNWGMASVLLCAGVGFGIIGQGLPHRRLQSLEELASGNDPHDRYGNISPQEAKELGKAMVMTALLVAAVTGALTYHRGFSLLWAITSALGAFVVFPVCAFALFCHGKAVQMKKK